MKPIFAVVSTDIRRDLVAPMQFFNRLEIVHFYRRTSYGDLTPDDLKPVHINYRTPWNLLQKVWRTHPNIVQGVEPFSIRLLPYTYAIFWIARFQHIPLVSVTLENRPLVEKFGAVFSRILPVALRPVFRYARLIICLNEGAKRNVLKVGPYEEKVQKFMYGTWGVDLDEFHPWKNGHEPNFGVGPVLLFVGRLHSEKGVFDLLDAFAIVKEHVPQATLVLVGEGPARPQIEQMIAGKSWGSSVFLTGAVRNRDLPPIFRAADLFVSPSITTRKWEEQVGMTNIQAMACGVPIVSTRSGAIPEYVPDGIAGILVPERNPRALADAILLLLADEELRQRMGEAGRAYAVARYDARKNVLMAEESILQALLD
jgi:glycosyltransferase involved in cell wall biosynthesis